MNSFYLTIHSDGDSHINYENSATNFKTQFGQSICLDGVWEVGLAELFYTMDMHCIYGPNESNLTFKKKAGDENKTLVEVITLVPEDKKGVYMTNEEMMHLVRNQITKTGLVADWTKHKRLRVSVPESLDVDEVAINLVPKLECILGFNSCILNKKEIKVGAGCLDIRRGFAQQLYVYTDIIHHQLIGTSYDKLLRIVPHNNVQYAESGSCSTIFSRIHYFPVNSEVLRGIEIHIKGKNNESLSFERGACTVTLHFRKLKNDR